MSHRSPMSIRLDLLEIPRVPVPEANDLTSSSTSSSSSSESTSGDSPDGSSKKSPERKSSQSQRQNNRRMASPAHQRNQEDGTRERNTERGTTGPRGVGRNSNYTSKTTDRTTTPGSLVYPAFFSGETDNTRAHDYAFYFKSPRSERRRRRKQTTSPTRPATEDKTPSRQSNNSNNSNNSSNNKKNKKSNSDKAHGYLFRWQQDNHDDSASMLDTDGDGRGGGRQRPLTTWQSLSGNVPVDRLSISIYLGKQARINNQAHSPGQLAVAIRQGKGVHTGVHASMPAPHSQTTTEDHNLNVRASFLRGRSPIGQAAWPPPCPIKRPGFPGSHFSNTTGPLGLMALAQNHPRIPSGLPRVLGVNYLKHKSVSIANAAVDVAADVAEATRLRRRSSSTHGLLTALSNSEQNALARSGKPPYHKHWSANAGVLMKPRRRTKLRLSRIKLQSTMTTLRPHKPVAKDQELLACFADLFAQARGCPTGGQANGIRISRATDALVPFVLMPPPSPRPILPNQPRTATTKAMAKKTSKQLMMVHAVRAEIEQVNMFAEDQLSLLVRLHTNNRNIEKHCARMRMAIQAADVAMDEAKQNSHAVIEKGDGGSSVQRYVTSMVSGRVWEVEAA